MCARKIHPFPYLNNNESLYSSCDHLNFLYFSDFPETTEILPLHRHSTVEFMLVTSGDVSVSIEGNRYAPSPYNLIITQAGALHHTEIHATSERYERYVLHLLPSNIEFLLHSHNLNPKDFDFLFHSGMLSFTKDEALNVLRIFQKGAALLQKHGTSSGDWPGFYHINPADKNTPYTSPILAMTNTYIIELILFIFLQRSTQQQAQPLTHPLVEKAVAYINQHYTDPLLSLNEITQELFVSSGYLSRTFRAYTGGTVYTFIMQTRLQYALKLLQEGNSVLDTCMGCGFQDYSSFLKAFKRTFSMSPREYINLCKTDETRARLV